MRRYGTPSSLLVVDADGFKPSNDHLGHPAGDRVLQELGALLRSRFRESDLLVRWGGDEFLVASVTISIGLAALDPFDAIALEQAYHRADQALYRAKQQGRNQVVTASEVGDDPLQPV